MAGDHDIALGVVQGRPDPASLPDVTKILEIAADTRKLEITLFWQRSLFFWGFNAAALVAYAAMAQKRPLDTDLLLAIASFGIVCSAAWALANRGSKYWQGAWEARLEEYEVQVLRVPLFSAPYTPRHRRWWGEWRYSVSRLAMALSDFMVGLWVFLEAKAVPGIQWPKCFYGPIVIPAVTFLYLALMLFFARSERQNGGNKTGNPSEKTGTLPI